MEARFSAPFQTDPGAYSASYTIGTGYFPGVKRPGHGVDHPPPSSAEVKKRVELYLYSPFWVFVACSRVNFTFIFTFVLPLVCSGSQPDDDPIGSKHVSSVFQYISNKMQRYTVYFIWRLLYVFRVVLPPETCRAVSRYK